MKTYAIIVTIIAFLALSVVGYGVWQGFKVKAYIAQLQTEKNQAIKDLRDTSENVAVLSNILRNSSDSFLVPGDFKAVGKNSEPIKYVDEGIKRTFGAQKTAIENSWDKFQKTQLINDYRQFVKTMADQMEAETKDTR